jgi:hypothetical protein
VHESVLASGDPETGVSIHQNEFLVETLIMIVAG